MTSRPRSAAATENPGVGHAERLEDPLPQELLERLPGGPGDQHPEYVRAEVVEPPLARLVGERQRAEPPLHPPGSGPGTVGGRGHSLPLKLGERGVHDRGTVPGGPHMPSPKPSPSRKVSRSRSVMARSAGTVSSSGASSRAKHPAAGELGQVLVHRVVQSQHALFHQHERRHRRDRLGHRRDPEEAVRPHRHPPDRRRSPPWASTCASPRRLTTDTSPGAAPAST